MILFFVWLHCILYGSAHLNAVIYYIDEITRIPMAQNSGQMLKFPIISKLAKRNFLFSMKKTWYQKIIYGNGEL